MTDVPLGAFLSGGVDSALVAAMVTRELDRALSTFLTGGRLPIARLRRGRAGPGDAAVRLLAPAGRKAHHLRSGDTLCAWQILDGRWPVYGRVQAYGDEGDLVTGVTLNERMPR